jgi:hypothetical protein
MLLYLCPICCTCSTHWITIKVSFHFAISPSVSPWVYIPVISLHHYQKRKKVTNFFPTIYCHFLDQKIGNVLGLFIVNSISVFWKNSPNFCTKLKIKTMIWVCVMYALEIMCLFKKFMVLVKHSWSSLWRVGKNIYSCLHIDNMQYENNLGLESSSDWRQG